MVPGIFDKIFSGNSLKARAAKAITLLASGAGAEMFLRFARNMILTRILLPEKLGLFALVMSVTAAFQAFTEIGIKHSVIQNEKGAEPEYLNNAWWFQAVRGTLLFIVGFFTAPYIGSFFDKQELIPFLKLSFLTILFNGLVSPQAHAQIRKLRFSKIVIIQQGGALIGVTVSIILVLVLRNLWAIVIGFVVEYASQCILSYIFCPFRPRFYWHREYSKELFHFAKGMFGLPILTVITTRTDIFVLGKLIPAEQLGLYQMALTLAQYPMGIFVKMINPVMLPVFSESQRDNKRTNNIILYATQILTIFALPAVAVISIFSKEILSLVWGPQFSVVASSFIILCLYTTIQVQAVPFSETFLALGKPHIHRRFVGLRAILLLAIIYPNILLWGMPGAAFSVLLSWTIVLCLQLIYMHKTMLFEVHKFGYYWARGIVLSVLIAIPCLILYLFDIRKNLLTFIVVVSLSIVIWCTLRPWRWAFKESTIN